MQSYLSNWIAVSSKQAIRRYAQPGGRRSTSSKCLSHRERTSRDGRVFPQPDKSVPLSTLIVVLRRQEIRQLVRLHGHRRTSRWFSPAANTTLAVLVISAESVDHPLCQSGAWAKQPSSNTCPAGTTKLVGMALCVETALSALATLDDASTGCGNKQRRLPTYSELIAIAVRKASYLSLNDNVWTTSVSGISGAFAMYFYGNIQSGFYSSMGNGSIAKYFCVTSP